jgi:hypothetical protein
MAKAESLLDLVDVKFQDATNHVSFNSDDIMGLVMPYYWGEADKVSIHNKTTFYEMYPESLPIGVKSLTDADRDIYSGYAQVKAYFAHGGGQVEVFRPSKGFGYQRMTIKDNQVVMDDNNQYIIHSDTQHDEKAQVSIALKYAGYVPQAMADGFDNIAIKVEKTDVDGYDSNDTIKITVRGCKFADGSYSQITNPQGNPSQQGWYEKVNGAYVSTSDTQVSESKTYYEKLSDIYEYAEVTPKEGDNPKRKRWYEPDGQGGFTPTTDTTVNDQKTYYAYQIVTRVYGNYTDLEVFEGSTNPLANISGESVYLEDVVNSQFIDVKVFEGIDNTSFTTVTAECLVYDNDAYTEIEGDDVSASSELDAAILDGYKYFRDFETSNCTLVINPYVSADRSVYEEINGSIASLAEYRKNTLAVVGYPIDTAHKYSYNKIIEYFVTGNDGVASNAKGNKFCIAVQGREIVSLFGYRFTLNCVAGYCGKMINVAKEAHLNQIASGYNYGTYGGSLKESLKSGEVIDLMESGVNSVYTSKRGNLIWGTRTMYSKQSSYFGKANVMRVCSMILKNIYPIAVETLHTDAASNPITRASVSTMLNSIIDTFIANQDLHADSYADCSDSINTDYLTKGGTVLNIILMLHFIGLVERVSIKIIATDTSVTAEFV